MFLYEPREDSELLVKYVKKHARGIVLDMGTGVGIQALAAATKKSVSRVVAVDVNPDAVSQCKKKIKNKKITFLVSDLFSSLRKKKLQFDTIVFNPPYLPLERGEDNELARALAGGKHGYEVIAKFLADAKAFLKEKGKILLVFSSPTHKDKVDEILTQQGFVWEALEELPLFFERLYCYKITIHPALEVVIKKGVRDITYLAHGKRGVVFCGSFGNKNEKVAIKIKKKESTAVGNLLNEARWLRVLNKQEIGPPLLFSGKDFLVYAFVEGDFIINFIEKNTKEKIKKVLYNVFDQCFQLDQLRVNKEEMHHPFKHIVVHRNAPVLLDFERMHKTKKPHNVTQFVQFVCALKRVLEKKGFIIDVELLRSSAALYKKKRIRDRLKKILLCLS